MGDWIDEHADKFEEEIDDNSRRTERSEQIRQQSWVFWDHVKRNLKNDVQKINTDERIQQKIKCQLKYSERNDSNVRIVREVFPAVYLDVCLATDTIEVKKEIATPIGNEISPSASFIETDRTEESEVLKFFLDGETLLLKNDAQDIMGHEKVSKYLLEPLLTPPTQIRRRY